MKELIVRTLSGILYISILIFSMTTSEMAFQLFFLFLALMTVREFNKLARLNSLIIFLILGVFFYAFSYLKFDFYATAMLLLFTVFTNLYLFKHLLWESNASMFKNKYAAAIFYLTSGFIFITLIPYYSGEFKPFTIFAVFILIWSNDTFAFVIGKSLGKHKLMEKVSPNKTVEGFLGGLVFACIVSFIIFKFTELYNPWIWIILAIITSIFGTLGDLVQSKFKRLAEVKDSGRIMPGHGGLYDRLDSIVYASPFIYIFLLIVDYVS